MRPKTCITDSYATLQPIDYKKGQSIHYAGKWAVGTKYFSDEFVTDWVSYQYIQSDINPTSGEVILSCKETHVADAGELGLIFDDHNQVIGVTGDSWEFVMAGGITQTAYDIAVAHGYKGTEAEWIALIQQQVITSGELDPNKKGAPELDIENVVRFDVDQTAKSEAEKYQARVNIDAEGTKDIVIAEDPTEDYYQANRTLDQTALVWEPQQLTKSQLEQAQENLHIADELRVKIIEKKIAELDEKGLTTLGNINDLNPITWDGHTGTTTGTVPNFFVDAINNLVGLIGEPFDDVVKKAGYSTNMVETLNYLYNLAGVIIKDVTPSSDKSGRIWYALCDSKGVEIPGSAVFKIPRDNEIHDVRIVEGGLDDSDPDNPKFIDGGTGHYWLRFISGYYDEIKAEWIDTEPVYCLIDRIVYVAKEEQPALLPDGVTDNPAYEGATVQTKIEENPITGFRDVSADIMVDTVDRKHLNKEGKLNYDFTGYDFTIDPTTAADYYVRCSQDYPGAIRLMPSNFAEIGPKMRPAYQPGELYYTYVRHMDVGQELNTVNQTLRDAVNELNDRYPVTFKVYENGVIDPDDGKTATEGSRYTYIFKQRTGEDPTELIDFATVEVPLEYRVVRVEHKVADGTEWLGNITDPEDYRAAHPELFAAEGDSLLDFYVTNGTKVEDPENPGEYIDLIEHLYCEMDVYNVKDEFLAPEGEPDHRDIEMMDPADPTQQKIYKSPAEVLADFEEIPQIQLYVSGYDNELSAKILFEGDRLPGSEIIP